MKTNFARKVAYAISTLFLIYLAIPSPIFPPTPPGALKSDEPGDTRNSLIQAFYSDMSREEIIKYFASQFNHSQLLKIPLPSIRLKNYPPEESTTKIMDELKSSYLEELVHPLRESVFINVFQPDDPHFAMIVKGTRYTNKITVRLYPSNTINRLIVGTLTIGCIWMLISFIRTVRTKNEY